MFDWLLPEKHAISILKKDHDIVKGLFEQFQKAEKPAQKNKIMQQALTELKIHAILEEEIFYPSVRRQIGPKVMNEADEEHHVAKVLIAELDHTADRNDHHDAKFTVLAENVRHHIKEEEERMLPKAKELNIDFEKLGQRMLDRKRRLLADGIPEDAEHAMVAKARGREDSPAQAAQHSARPTKRKTTTSTHNGNGRKRTRGSR